MQIKASKIPIFIVLASVSTVTALAVVAFGPVAMLLLMCARTPIKCLNKTKIETILHKDEIELSNWAGPIHLNNRNIENFYKDNTIIVIELSNTEELTSDFGFAERNKKSLVFRNFYCSGLGDLSVFLDRIPQKKRGFEFRDIPYYVL